MELNTANPEERLIVYGSLAPGGSNAFMLKSLGGEWYRCLIRGYLGRYRGFKSFRYDPQGPEHSAWLFSSSELPGFIQDLDEFEGEEYERIVIPAQVGDRWFLAQVYEGKCWD